MCGVARLAPGMPEFGIGRAVIGRARRLATIPFEHPPSPLTGSSTKSTDSANNKSRMTSRENGETTDQLI